MVPRSVDVSSKLYSLAAEQKVENGEWIFPTLDKGRIQQQCGSVESNHHVFSKVIAPFHVVHDHLNGSVGETAECVCQHDVL